MSTNTNADALFGALLRAVSHDLKSPLLTLSLGAELLTDEDAAPERAELAREAMRNGVRELERMLEAVTMLSRARGRILEPREQAIADVLPGRSIVGPASALEATAFVDLRLLGIALGALDADIPPALTLELQHGAAVLSTLLPHEWRALEASPLLALCTSLQRYASTPVGQLAAAQVEVERQGGSMSVRDGELIIRLPLANERAR